MGMNGHTFKSKDDRIVFTANPILSGWTVSRWREGESASSVVATFHLEDFTIHPNAVDREIACRRQAVSVAKRMRYQEEIAMARRIKRGAKTSIAEQVRKQLGWDTLQTRRGDSWDFHEVAVWEMCTVIDAVFESGIQTAGDLLGKEYSVSDNEKLDPAIELLQMADLNVLTAVARGELDLNRLALHQLASRGMDPQGKWIGFDEAGASIGKWSNHLPGGEPQTLRPSPSPRNKEGPGR